VQIQSRGAELLVVLLARPGAQEARWRFWGSSMRRPGVRWSTAG
jgi:hypothetical protein